MSFVLVAHDKLKQSIKESIITLIKHHTDNRPVDPDKLKEAVVKLPDDRRTQAEFLLKVISLTDLMDTSNPLAIQRKARVLNAAAYYVHTKIEKSYDEGYISRYVPKFIMSEENSDFFKSLRTALVIDDENKPNNNDLVDMYKDLKQFLCNHVYKDGDPRKPYLDLQAFSADSVQGVYGYEVEKDIRDLTDKVSTIEDTLVRAAKKLHQASLRPAKSGGFFSGWLGGASTIPAPVKDTHKDDITSAAPH